MTTLPFACETARSRTVEVHGLRLHYLEWGAAGRPPLCLLHGGSAHAHWFDGVAAAFADRFHVVSLDQRGHGESQWPEPAAYHTEDFAADLAALADTLGWKTFALAGHSMGGHNAMAFAGWHPERVSALVIIDSRPTIPEHRLDAMHRRGARGPRIHATREAAMASFRLLPPETAADPALLAHLAEVGLMERDGGWCLRFDPDANGKRRPVDVWPLLPRITAPTLVVRAEGSAILSREMAEEVRAAIPKASIVEVPGAYHHLTLDQPAAFTAILDEFLRGVGLG